MGLKNEPYENEQLMVKVKSGAIRKKIKEMNEELDLIWKGFPHDKLIYKQVLVEMLKNIKTNSEIIIDMLEEMQYDSVRFNTKGVRNDK
tara:strand:- start:9014 stop:9280 length:267 start_codon:yes stop_codon:yes gene_type:complete